MSLLLIFFSPTAARDLDVLLVVGAAGTEEYGKKFEKSEYTDVAYYGEYPLCLAACFASKEIYDYLIDQGADPNLIGKFSF